MRTKPVVIVSALHFALAPGVVAGLVPWLLTGWQPDAPVPLPVRLAGLALVAASAVVLAHAFGWFVVEGRGTPAPVAPTERLVVGGLYRHVRNPMYLAVIAAVLGQAVALGQVRLLWYAGAVTVAVVAFVHWYEEPALRRRYGSQYELYRRNVRGWWPRLRPWTPTDQA